MRRWLLLQLELARQVRDALLAEAHQQDVVVEALERLLDRREPG
jgi:hypothetical protein